MSHNFSKLNVKKLTESVILIASLKFNLKNKLDNRMFNHVVYVSNRILMMIKDDGITPDVLEESGKYLWRLLNVLQAYNTKREDVSLSKILKIVLEFKNTFGD